MTLKVGVLGARGRMGAEVCAAVNAASDLELAAAVDAGDDREALRAAEVVVDFTAPSVVMDNLRWCLQSGLSVVVGTTGFDDARLEEVRGWLAQAPSSSVLIAPNFGIGAVLMMRFAELAARWYRVRRDRRAAPPRQGRRSERHCPAHRRAHRRGRARRPGLPPPARMPPPPRSRARGAPIIAGVPVHAIRLAGLVAHQEVLFGTEGETLTLRHDSLDRRSFMPGVLMAVRAVRDRPGLTVGIEDLLGL